MSQHTFECLWTSEFIINHYFSSQLKTFHWNPTVNIFNPLMTYYCQLIFVSIQKQILSTYFIYYKSCNYSVAILYLLWNTEYYVSLQYDLRFGTILYFGGNSKRVIVFQPNLLQVIDGMFPQTLEVDPRIILYSCTRFLFLLIRMCLDIFLLALMKLHAFATRVCIKMLCFNNI